MNDEPLIQFEKPFDLRMLSQLFPNLTRSAQFVLPVTCSLGSRGVQSFGEAQGSGVLVCFSGYAVLSKPT
jgi:hypothetical protein